MCILSLLHLHENCKIDAHRMLHLRNAILDLDFGSFGIGVKGLRIRTCKCMPRTVWLYICFLVVNENSLLDHNLDSVDELSSEKISPQSVVETRFTSSFIALVGKILHSYWTS